MRNFKNFKNIKNLFSSFRNNPRFQKALQNPIALVLGINTALYVFLYSQSDCLETQRSV